MTTTLNSLRDELALQNQRGITFIMAAAFYWTIVGLAGIYFPDRTTFMISVWCTGIIFPLSIGFAKILGINLFFKNELTPLGLWANIFQLFFFPVFFLSAKFDPQFPPVFMGVLAGAHFVFYHWLYRSHAYLIMAFTISLNSYLTGLLLPGNAYVTVGLSNAALLLLGAGLLHLENRKQSINKPELKSNPL